jgi:hypothetical protein
MLEGQFTRELIKRLRAHHALRDAYIVKHANPFTAGVPDFSVSVGIRTLWVEVKRHEKNPTKLQWHTVNKLKNGAIVVWFKGREVFYWAEGACSDWLSINALCDEIARRVTR